MSKAKKAKQVLTYGARGFYYKEPIPFPPENQPKSLPTLDPLTGKEPQEQTLEELKLEAKEMGIRGWNFYKDPEKLKAKIEDAIRFQPSN